MWQKYEIRNVHANNTAKASPHRHSIAGQLDPLGKGNYVYSIQDMPFVKYIIQELVLFVKLYLIIIRVVWFLQDVSWNHIDKHISKTLENHIIRFSTWVFKK